MAIEKEYERQILTSNLLFSSWASTVPRYMAQTFTVGTVGTNEAHLVTRIAFNVKKIGSPTGNIKVQVRKTTDVNTPSDEILAEASFDISTITTSSAWYSVTMNLPYELSTSTIYAIVWEPPDGTHDASNYYSMYSSSSEAYAGGIDAYSDDGGITWSNTASRDVAFRTYGVVWTGTLATYNDVVSKVGADVATELTTGNRFELLNNLVLQAESMLNTITRYNWIDAYSGLNADVKFVLNDVVSSMAAINAIAYDMDGYGDRVTAEDMINVQRDNVLRGISILRDKKQQDFINGA